MKKIKINITERDYQNSQWLHHNVSILTFFGVTVLCVFLGVFMHDVIKLSSPTSIGGSVGVWVWYVFYYFIYLRFRIKKLYRQQVTLHSPTEITWDKEKIYFNHKVGHTELEWKNYVKYKENNKILLLYQADNVFNIFPITAFNSKETLDDFRSHIYR